MVYMKQLRKETDKMEIVIVETSAVSSNELKALIKEIIPEASVHEIIDSSLIDEVVANNGPSAFVKHRMKTYFEFAEEMGADIILNQCSSVGEVAKWIGTKISVPVVSIDKGMAVEAVNKGKKIGLVATVKTTVKPSSNNILNTAKELNKDIELKSYLCDGAMEYLMKTGDKEGHNQMVIDLVKKAVEENDVVCLAQGSMTALEPYLGQFDKPVYTSLRIGVEYLKKVLYETVSAK